MKNFALVQLARGIAFGAHAGQFDKAGLPYILHPERVASRVSTVEEQVLAWLHDVVEDTDVSLSDLAYVGFPEEIVRQVDALTHRPREPRVDYYARILEWPAARRVKLADVEDNSDPSRLHYLDSETQERLQHKYEIARAVLGG